jgi:hypothetical protein
MALRPHETRKIGVGAGRRQGDLVASISLLKEGVVDR